MPQSISARAFRWVLRKASGKTNAQMAQEFAFNLFITRSKWRSYARLVMH